MADQEEERRRRCIIDPSQCSTGLTQEAALAETLADYDSPDSGVEDCHHRMAKGLLSDFTFADARPGRGKPEKPPTEGL